MKRTGEETVKSRQSATLDEGKYKMRLEKEPISNYSSYFRLLCRLKDLFAYALIEVGGASNTLNNAFFTVCDRPSGAQNKKVVRDKFEMSMFEPMYGA